MAFVDDINYKETISKHKLVLKSKWLDLADTFLFVFVASFFLVCLFLTFKGADLSRPSDSFFGYYVIPVVALLTLIFLYKKLFEKRLLTLETRLDKKQAREQIVALVKSWNWNIRKNNADYLQATTGFGLRWGKQVTIIYDANKIYLNVMADNPMVRMPVLFSDKSIKQDIAAGLKANL